MILQRYIFRGLLFTFLLTFVALCCVMVIATLFQIFREYSGPGLELLVKATPSLLAYVLPYCILVAAGVSATLAYGRFASDNEIDAMRASGYSVLRTLLPAFWLGLALSAASWYAIEEVAPQAHYERRILIKESVLMILKNPPQGPTMIDIGPYKINYLDARDGVLIEPKVLRLNRQAHPQERFRAETGTVRFPPDGPPAIELRNVSFEDLSDPENPKTGRAGRIVHPLQIGGLLDKPKRAMDMTRSELKAYILDEETKHRHRREGRMEYYDRYGRILGPFLLMMIGACVGILTRKGNRLAGLGASLPCVVGYLVLWAVGRGIGEKGGSRDLIRAMTPDGYAAAVAFATDGIALAVLLVLLWKIVRR